MDPDALSVAVIGAGMAGRSHANGYRQAPTVFGAGLPPLRLAAIADVNTELAGDAARRYGYERSVGSWEAVAEDPSIDVVSVVVGNDLHRPVVEALLAAGKHVLCEKPLAGSLADAEAMVAAAARTDAVTGVGYTYRCTPAFAAVAERVADGRLGTVSALTGRYWCDYSCDPGAPMTWRYRGGPGSGALGDLGAHTIDLAELLCGPVTAVSGAQLTTVTARRPLPLGATVGHRIGAVSTETAEVENEDAAVFTARFAGGAVGSFSVSRVAFGFANGQALDVSGTGGRAALDWQRPAELVLDDAQPAAGSRGPRAVLAGPAWPSYGGGLPMDAPGVSYGVADLFTWQARAFLDQVVAATDGTDGTDGTDAASAGLPPCASFADGLHTLRVIDAVVASAAAQGAPVAVED